LAKLECGLFFGVRSEDPLLGNGGVFFLVRSGAVAWQDNKQVVFSFWSVLRLVLGNDNNDVVFFWSVLRLLLGNDNKQEVFSFLSVLGLLLGNDNKPLPRERGYRAVPSGTCLSSRSRGNVFIEPLRRVSVYRSVALGTWLLGSRPTIRGDENM
jgi:hypothetical protein